MASTHRSDVCFGVLNLSAAAEASALLRESPKQFHQQLNAWLIENYLDSSLQKAIASREDPLGCRIRSAEDLSILARAYSNARALKGKAFKKGMSHELYFYGQTPDRDAAMEAGGVITQFDPDNLTRRVSGMSLGSSDR